MPKAKNFVVVAPGEAVFIVEAMMLDGRIDAETLREYRARYHHEITSIEARLARLRDLATSAFPVAAGIIASSPRVRRAGRRAARRAVRATKRAAVSPQRRKTRALQGKYLSLIRQIPKSVVKQRFGQAIAKKGKEAVIGEMEKYVRAKRG